MAESNFIDYVRINCKSGKGGAGSHHMRREKFAAFGGPDGGDGGRGGHIFLRGNKQMWTLLHLKYRKHIKAGNGDPGGKSRSSGADGEDVVFPYPLLPYGAIGEANVHCTHLQTTYLPADQNLQKSAILPALI